MLDSPPHDADPLVDHSDLPRRPWRRSEAAVAAVAAVVFVLATGALVAIAWPGGEVRDDAQERSPAAAAEASGDAAPTATDPAGSTMSPEPAPAPPAAAKLPAKIVGGYLEGWIGDVYPSELPQEFNLLFHAFAKVVGDGSVYLEDGRNSSPARDVERLKREYREFIAAGKPVILSIGGHEGAAVGLTTEEQVTNFVASIVPIIEEWGFSGIDWDLELGIAGGISADGIVDASRRLKSHFGADFMITMAPIDYDPPEGPPHKAVYKAAACELGDDLTFVATQNYNLREFVTAETILAIMNEWLTECDLRPDQYAIGFWFGENYYPSPHPGADVFGHTYTEEYMAEMYEAVVAVHPDVRGAWVWGVAANDSTRGHPFAPSLAPVVLG